jgi:DNA-directed RNA polymerase sigma subunit (sigma70/sigma32)
MERAMTQCEVAKELGISQARVLQIEQSAFRKLRACPEFQKLTELARFTSQTTAGGQE